MIGPAGIKASARRTAKRAAAGLFAAVCTAVGLGLLTAAAWMVLARLEDPVFAATVLGCAYLGLAAIVAGTLALAGDASHGASHGASHDTSQGVRGGYANGHGIDAPSVAKAFMDGLAAGRSARRNGR